MKWSWRIGVVADVRIQVHWTFLILIAWIVFIHMARGAGPLEVLGGVVLVLAVFGCVVLHELGHAVTARQFGIPTRDITLLPIGGVARLERMPDEPRQEFAIAIAGPLVNVAIAALLAVVLTITGTMKPVGEVNVVGGSLLVQLMWVNIVLVIFNLLPAFPMDGGRILRSLLATRINYVKATRIAAGVGQGMAVLFGFIGLMGNPFLVFIAIFVFLGAQAEAMQAELRVSLEGLTVRDAMMRRFKVLETHDTLGLAVDELLAGSQVDFPVVTDDRFAGLLLRSDLMQALTDHGRSALVGDVMRTECVTSTEGEDLQTALRRMQGAKCSTMPVVSDGMLRGLLTTANLGEYLMVQAAEEGTGGRSRMGEVLSRG